MPDERETGSEIRRPRRSEIGRWLLAGGTSAAQRRVCLWLSVKSSQFQLANYHRQTLVYFETWLGFITTWRDINTRFVQTFHTVVYNNKNNVAFQWWMLFKHGVPSIIKSHLHGEGGILGPSFWIAKWTYMLRRYTYSSHLTPTRVKDSEYPGFPSFQKCHSTYSSPRNTWRRGFRRTSQANSRSVDRD